MVSHRRVRLNQVLREAEGYLELDMPQHALGALTLLAETDIAASSTYYYLRGEALRATRRFGDALVPLNKAAELAPGNVHVWIALGWCYKRIGEIDLAIESLERALEVQEDEALIYYNLACYWSIAGNKRQALDYLSRSLAMDPQYRDLVLDESDFDPIRSDPDFQALTSVIV